MAPDSGTFVGRVEEKHGSAVTFLVESLQAEPARLPAKPHAPVVGQVVVVRYERHQEQFLHVSQHYLVEVWWLDVYYFSSIHTAGNCPGGTVYPDGSEIDTALVHQPHLRHVLLEYLTGLAVAGLGVAGWAVRKRRRQRRNVEELLAESNS
jgi:hypothetical protein